MSVEENLELMRTLDDAWNSQDWEVFRKRHAENTAVYWPGQPEPTRGRDNHEAESREFFKMVENNLENNPYKVMFGHGDWTCTIADWKGKMIGPMTGPDGKTGPITLISKEPDPAYPRVALPYILSKEKNLRQITLQDDGYFRANNVETIIGTGASGLDTANKTVTLENGRDISYDKLLIATGSTSRVPPVLGIDQADVCYHWTLADTRKLEEQMANARNSFVIGAGFISLLTVSALIKTAPLKYTVVEIADQVMPQLLDETGGKALERGMREKGIDVLLGDSVTAIEPSPNGSGSQPDARGSRHYSITLGSGKTCDADMIVCGTGVRPNVDFLSGSEVKLVNGVVTDDRQETSIPDVYAAGDCA